MNGRIALSTFFALAWVVQARSASLGLGAVVLEPGKSSLKRNSF